MARCAFCKAQEAQGYEFGVPICPDCLDIGKAKPNRIHISSALVRDLNEATVQFEAASSEFNSIVDDIPSHLPHPDGTQRIQNVSQKLAAARKTRGRAYNRLDDFLSRGVVPEELKQSG
jgi:hypothetical protein